MIEAEAVEIIESMVKFMKNTNKMLEEFKLKIDNQQIDIDKLKKKKDNGKLIHI